MDKLMLLAVTLSCVAYCLCFLVKGVPESVSATYYTFGKHGWVFQVLMVLVGLLLMPLWLAVSDDCHQWLCFLACASLVFIGVAPCFKLELDGKVHYTSAVVCCVCVVLWQIVEGLWDVTLFFAWIGGMLSLMWRDKWCWWVEWAIVGGLLANLWRVI